MKTIKVILSLLIAANLSLMAQQSADEQAVAARRKKEKEARKELNEKAGKLARKEGKALEKEGWDVAVGGLPLKKQLDNVYMKQSEMDNDGDPKWFIANARATANTQAAAKLSAMELAKLDLAGQLGSNITGLVENSLANSQISEEEATSVQKVIAAATNVISASLGRVLVFTEFYKKVGDGNIQCAVFIGTNAKLAEQQAKKAVRKKLEEETNVVREKLDKMLGIDAGAEAK
ncbi:MAG: hypothetical protein NW207_05225 [Cytophagales bacterium]|nr:hypothetical protein [Cytophagales bacterium]